MYNYEVEKESLLASDSGVKMFLKINNTAMETIKRCGVVYMSDAIAGNYGSTWKMFACIDRLVELGEIREITQGDVDQMNRIFSLSYLA